MPVAERLAALGECYDLPADAGQRLALLLELVQESSISLTAVRAPERAVDVHVGDSLLGLRVPQIRSASALADLGSGGGFPGLVLAVALPGARVTLVESVAKKAAFLDRARDRLELANVDVVAARAEEWDAGRESQDVVTARALAPLTTLVEYAAPLLRRSGVLVAWKGPAAVAEIADATVAARVLGMSSPAEPEPRDPGTARRGTRLYVSSKVSATPAGYPRRAGMARKRPITTST